ncbi:MAG: lysylphosphatidylglycerol synthase transmembrane domain-containing protein [Thermoanaerobaculia bacterium]
MPATETAPHIPNEPTPRPRSLTLSKKIFGVACTAALLALVVLAIRRSPAEVFSFLRDAQPAYLAAGFLLNVLAFGVRAFRFNLLLPPADRIPLATAWSLSGATTFLLQVMPFRSGDLASWVSIRAALGASWARSAAVFALVKLLDTATLLLAGLAGAAWLLFSRRTHVLGLSAGALVFVGAGLLLALPFAGGRLLASLVPRLPAGGRRHAIAREVAEGLSVAREEPGAYALAAAAASAFLALHVPALWLTARGLGLSIHPATLAVALFTSIATAAVLPSPAGTFGPYESGFAAAVALDGIPLARGAILGGCLHLLTTLAAFLTGLPFLLSHLSRLRENRSRRNAA